ncbi:hypothetical protein OQA88_9986 [Cercophora sp. LCS_1]
MALSPLGTVELTASLRKRLYEPVVLLSCLTTAYIEAGRTEIAEPESTSRQESYFVFVNKLAQICDSKRGGDTVTAFAVLQPNSVEYRFASNGRKASELKKVKAYITDILTVLDRAPQRDIALAATKHKGSLFSDVLVKIIVFNRRRLECYIRALQADVSKCIQDASEVAVEDEADSDGEVSHKVAEFLKRLEPLVASALKKVEVDGEKVKMKNEEYSEKTQALMHAIHQGYQGDVKAFVADRCVQDPRQDRMHWDEVYHALGRLLSYFISVTVLAKARRYWPNLFNDFKVDPIPSSRPSSDPPSVRKSAEKIIPTLASRDTAIVDAYSSNAEQLQLWGLDKSIKEITRHSHFKTIVHAEVLVDDSIRRDRRQSQGEPLHFFMEDEFGEYIGASKPTCRLCALYFDSQTDGFKVRPSHNNLYHKWRPADLTARDPQAVRKERDEILERMIPKLRDGVFRAIRQKSAPWKRFDSNNTATSPAFPTGTDITTQMGSMRISSGDAETVRGSSPEVEDEEDDEEEEDDDDEE